MNRIYIIGCVGSGKSTFSRYLSNKYKIDEYELDNIVWDDSKHVKRSDLEIKKLFSKIIKKDSWIIEDVGRSKFSRGREYADTIYYLKISKLRAYFRVSKRWLREKIGLEEANYPPTIKNLIYIISIVRSYKRKEKDKIKDLEEYKDKIIHLKQSELCKIMKYNR